MNLLENRQLLYSRVKGIDEVLLITTIREQALQGIEFCNVGVSLDLVHVTVFVIELATNAIGALSRLEEGFAVFVFDVRFLSRLLFSVAMGEFALFSVAAESDFNPVFAELCFVFGLKFVRLDHLRLACRLFGASVCLYGFLDGHWNE